MRKALSMLLAALMFTSLFAISAVASDGNVDTGQRLYLRLMADHVGMNSADFATLHSQAEWTALLENNGEKFAEKFAGEYPGLQGYLNGDLFPRHVPHLRAFLVHFANDSGNFPSCAG